MKILPEARHHNFRNELIAILKKYAGHLSDREMLALSAHLVGQMIAIQNQRTMTREQALDIIIKNIEQGNKEVIDALGKGNNFNA